MSTELAIAAVKAQALWDAASYIEGAQAAADHALTTPSIAQILRRLAAEAHPEFQRMLDAQVLRRHADAGVVAAEAVES